MTVGGQWEHNLNIKTGSGSKHSISTVYKTPGARSQEVTTSLDLDGMKPVTLSGQANLDWDDLQMAGSVKHGKVRVRVVFLSGCLSFLFFSVIALV